MTVRPVRPSDYAEVNRLHRLVGWGERSRAGWAWLEANPARVEIDAPAGWVIEDRHGRVGAFGGNLVQRYRLGAQIHHGATGFSIIVPRDMRGSAQALLRAFVGQPGLFTRCTFNANARSAPLYGRHGLRPWPPDTHAVKLSWIADPIACAKSRALRAAAARWPEAATRLARRFGDVLMNSRTGALAALDLPNRIEPLTDLGDGSAYAGFWHELVAEGRLLADRAPAALRWRLADPDMTTRPILLARHCGQAITGYAYAVLSKASVIDPPTLEIIDLIALEGDAGALPALVRSLTGNAWRLGAAKVRLPLLTGRLLRQLGPLGRRARREGGWGHAYAAFADGGPDPALWSLTPFDGDYGVCCRPVPVRSASLEPARVSLPVQDAAKA